MKYYQKNIGDYRKKTGHLSIVEHGVYNMLLDTYYDTEAPLELDKKKLKRLHCVRSEEETEAFYTVLDEFFIKTEDGYRHNHADEQLEKIYAKSDKARESANARWNRKKAQQDAKDMRRTCERNANAYPEDANAPETDANDMRSGCYPLPITHNPLPTKKNSASYDAEFDMFWAAGMKKVDKKKARSAFTRIIKKQADPQQFTEMLVTDIANKLKANQQGFELLHPTTYLNGERWDDEITEQEMNNGQDQRRNQPGGERLSAFQRAKRDAETIAQQINDGKYG